MTTCEVFTPMCNVPWVGKHRVLARMSARLLHNPSVHVQFDESVLGIQLRDIGRVYNAGLWLIEITHFASSL